MSYLVMVMSINQAVWESGQLVLYESGLLLHEKCCERR